MKKCPYCGKEYGDEVVRCPIDGELIVDGETITPPPPPSVLEALPAAISDRRMRIFEVVLVCLIAFGTSIITSTHTYLFSDYNNSGRTAYAWMLQIFRESTALGLLWYVLIRRGKTFSDLGFKWRLDDVVWSVVLRIAGTAAFYLVYQLIYYCHLTTTSHQTAAARVSHFLFAGGVYAMTMLFQFVNPFFEELIVRAYLMTEIKLLSNSTMAAIAVSTILQTSYHLYQGAPAAISHGATFLVFSIYYAKTNRIIPVILAHLYSDVGSTLYYWVRG